jgi:hypothetical protein
MPKVSQYYIELRRYIAAAKAMDTDTVILDGPVVDLDALPFNAGVQTGTSSPFERYLLGINGCPGK